MPNSLQLQRAKLPSPLGAIWVVSDREQRVRALDWEGYEERMFRLLGRHYGSRNYSIEDTDAPPALRSAFRAYFGGDVCALDALPVATNGTPFQRDVWTALRTIPVGTTVTYGELARRIGHPRAIRAVGLANGSNPIGVIVPCHRVIGAGGSLTGYAHGLDRKLWLLEHEGVRLEVASSGRRGGPFPRDAVRRSAPL